MWKRMSKFEKCEHLNCFVAEIQKADRGGAVGTWLRCDAFSDHYDSRDTPFVMTPYGGLMIGELLSSAFVQS